MTGEVAETKCHCGKICKNLRGLRIHQARTKCKNVRHQKERTDNSDKTDEDHSQDSHHSAEDLNPTEAAQDDRQDSGEPGPAHVGMEKDLQPRKDRVKWPPSNDKQWDIFDEDMEMLLESVLVRDVEKKITTLTTMVYTVGMERFGTTERKEKKTSEIHANRRQQAIQSIKGELKVLTRQYRWANEMEKTGLSQLRSTLREKMRGLQKAERMKKSLETEI